jgi:NADPH-dependent glutamate synthase beta subunit-like oxidoreductase
MRIDGEELTNVYQATEFLVRGNLEPEQLPENMREPLDCADKNVLVVGGGDTSMDCVRTAIRLGAKSVTCMYRRTEAEQKGREEERRHAREEGGVHVPRYRLDSPARTVASRPQNACAAPRRAGRIRRRRPEPIPAPTSLPSIPSLAIGYSPTN